jgi:N-acetyl-beta-hexosaminidase
MVVAAAAGAACGGSDSPTGPAPSPSDTIAGSFTLNKVNTSGLPATIASDPGNYSLQITAGSAVLQGNGTQFIIAITSKETVAGHASTYIDSTSGTWTQLTAAITFTRTAGGATTTSTAMWDGTNLTIISDGDTYIFKKR